MPVNDFESPFERIVLTQAAISAAQLMREWLQQKKKAQEEPEDIRRAQKLAALDPDRGNSREEVSRHLLEAFKADHAAIFKYASRYNKRRENRVFQIDQLQPEHELNLKKHFDAFVAECYEEDGRRKPMGIEQAAGALQRFYENVKYSSNADGPDCVPLRYKRFPMGLIISQLGSSEKWKDINNGQGIDFNRGDKPEPGQDLAARFVQAFDGELDARREREFKGSHFITHHESHVDIAGYRFPCMRFGWGQTHVLTDTGYFVDLNEDMVKKLSARLKEKGRAESCMIDFTPPAPKDGEPATQHVSGFTDTASASLDHLKRKLTKLKEADKVDGRDARNGKAMLVSMDIDLLTGLSLKETKNPDGSARKSEAARLGAFISKHAKEIRGSVPADLTSMSNFLALMPEPDHAREYETGLDEKFNKLLRIAHREEDTDALELIKAARPYVKTIVPRIMRVVEKHFENKETGEPIKTQAALLKEASSDEERRQHEQPRYFMTLGGAAAGKSGAETLADEECGKGNYVIAGLDHVRSHFYRQAINVATDNHNFDYKNIEEAGKLVRAMVLERARDKGYHVLLDGSGIPYEGRYSKIVAGFRQCEHEYKTNVIGFDRTLYVNNPALREQLWAEGKAPKDALLQQGIRIGHQLRAMPVKMIANNYAAMPEALLQASQDANVDRFWLIDTNPKKVADKAEGAGGGARSHPHGADSDIHPYILSFTTEVTAEQLDQLDGLKGQQLRQAIASMQDEREHSPRNRKIAQALNHPIFRPEHIPAEQWDFKVVSKMRDGKYRIEIITDSERYVSTIQKGLFNREVNGPEELFKLTKVMGFDVEGLFATRGGTLQVQPDREVCAEAWPKIPFATSHSLAARYEKCLRVADHDQTISFQVVTPSYAGAGRA